MEVSDVPDLAQTHPYTCNSCAVAFRNSDAQRNHMRSDWHRYNLKRKVAELPPVSQEDYNEKVLTAQAAAKATADGATFSKLCEICQKNYFSENAYRNHVASQKHKLRAVTAERESERTTTASKPTQAESPTQTPKLNLRKSSVGSRKLQSLSKIPSQDGLHDLIILARIRQSHILYRHPTRERASTGPKKCLRKHLCQDACFAITTLQVGSCRYHT